MPPKVSIVVPIYKVEKYLQRCVESILHQTYSNLEIILVDDGSPDGCGEIAARYAAADPRVTYVYKDNGGLSDARNAGMRYVTGHYTMFVDSDDWLDRTMVEKMVEACINLNADLVQAAFYYAYDDYLLFDHRSCSSDRSVEVLNNKSAMSELVRNEKIKNFAWGKLFQTEMIWDIPFKVGALFEDSFWTHQVVFRVNRYAILHAPMYYYYQRNDSIVATYNPRNTDLIKGMLERHSFLEQHYADLLDESYKALLKANLIHFTLLLVNWKKDRHGVYRKEIRAFIKNNYGKLKTVVADDEQLRRQLRLFAIHPYVNFLFLGMRKALRRFKVLPTPLGLERINLH